MMTRRYARIATMRTRLFPFTLDLEIAKRTLVVGSTLRLMSKFHGGALIRWWLARGEQRLGDINEARGMGERWLDN